MSTVSFELPRSEIHLWRIRLDTAASLKDPAVAGSSGAAGTPTSEVSSALMSERTRTAVPRGPHSGAESSPSGTWGNDAELFDWLSPDEIARARRFHFDRDRRRFCVSRAILRRLLGSYIGVSPRDVHFSYGEYGKPCLESWDVGFNVSHSNDLALIGIVRGGDIGVDIEYIRPDYPTDEVAARFFSTAETRGLSEVADAERALAFFRCWTRKEACIKAHGRGLSIPLDAFSVPTQPAPLHEFVPVNVHDKDWLLRDVAVADGYAAAVAMFPGTYDIRLLDWDDTG
jgi:4'-phosphopantetheinyl transferase